jgi:hypothetical protein
VAASTEPILDYRPAAPASGFACSHTPDGTLVIIVAPTRVRPATVVWIAIGTLVSAALLLTMLAALFNFLDDAHLPRAGVLMPAFLLIVFGGWTLTTVLGLGEQATFHAYADGSLYLTQRYLFNRRGRDRAWPRGDVVRIEAHRHGTNWSGREIFELWITSRRGQGARLLPGRAGDELRALATTLAEKLGTDQARQ